VDAGTKERAEQVEKAPSVWPDGYQIVFWAGLAFATLIAFGSSDGRLVLDVDART
jgi:hypothetical protein